MSALKRVFQVAGVAALAAAVARLVKDRLVPQPEPLEGVAPAFRTLSTPPPAPPSTAPPAGAGDDLSEIHGIGPVYAGRLADNGITTFSALAAADAATLATALEVSESQVEGWIAEAKQLASS